jgi:hypothetical protein
MQDGLVDLAQIVIEEGSVVAPGEVGEDLLLALGVIGDRLTCGFRPLISRARFARSLSSPTIRQSTSSIRPRSAAILAWTSASLIVVSTRV